MDTEQKPAPQAPPNASWGAIISIVVILAMIVIGAFYSWEKRVGRDHETRSLPVDTATSTQPY